MIVIPYTDIDELSTKISFKENGVVGNRISNRL
jgi:hypothetical protein